MAVKLHINQLIRVLGLLKSSKLEYLKTAEDAILPKYNAFTDKRVYAIIIFRNWKHLRSFHQDTDIMHIKGVQMEQRLIASLEDSQKTSFENCLDIDVQIIDLLERIETTKIQLDSLIQKLKDAVQTLTRFENKSESGIKSSGSNLLLLLPNSIHLLNQ